jgi:hypothetical protein
MRRGDPVGLNPASSVTESGGRVGSRNWLLSLTPSLPLHLAI